MNYTSEPDIEAAWSAEIERRLVEIDAGTVELISWGDVEDFEWPNAAGGYRNDPVFIVLAAVEEGKSSYDELVVVSPGAGSPGGIYCARFSHTSADEAVRHAC